MSKTFAHARSRAAQEAMHVRRVIIIENMSPRCQVHERRREDNSCPSARATAIRPAAVTPVISSRYYNAPLLLARARFATCRETTEKCILPREEGEKEEDELRAR